MIPIDTLESMFWAAVTVVVWLGLAVPVIAILWVVVRWAGRAVARKRARLTTGQKIIAGLEDAVAHARGEPGRAKVTRPSAPETGSGLRFGAGDTAAGGPQAHN